MGKANEVPVGAPIATSLPEQPIGIACPACWNNGTGPMNMLYGRAGLFGYYCKIDPKNHFYNDLELLKAQGSPKMQVAAKPDAAQVGWVSMTLQLPPDVLNRLKEKFGDKLASTLSQVLRVLTAGRVFIVGADDIARIEAKFGHKVEGLPQFLGEVLSLAEKLSDAEERVAGAAEQSTTQSVNGEQIKTRRGEMVVWFNPDVTRQLQEKATFNKQTAEEVVENIVTLGIENNWA